MSINKIILSFLFILSNSAQAIVCSTASSNVEQMICSSTPLMQLDTALNKWYSEVEKSQIIPNALHSEEKIWLQQRNQCTDESCLIASYKLRLSQLREIERYSSAKTVASSIEYVVKTQSLPYSSDGNAISVTGSEYSLQAKEWVYKPFYTQEERLKLLKKLKEIDQGASNETRIEKLIGGFAANNTFYFYFLHYNGVHHNDSREKKSFRTWQLVQISEQGDVKIVDSSNDENKPKGSEADYRLNAFKMDTEGNIHFINNTNARPTLKRWSATQQKLETLSDEELTEYQNNNIKKGTWSWEGECEDVKCKSRMGKNGSAHFALHYPGTARKNPKDNYTSYGADFADSLFYIKPDGGVHTILKENNNNRNTWYLFSEPTCTENNGCYFINHHGMAGVWQINQQEKMLTHITSLSRIEEIAATRQNEKDYIFMLFDSTDTIYVATEDSVSEDE